MSRGFRPLAFALCTAVLLFGGRTAPAQALQPKIPTLKQHDWEVEFNVLYGYGACVDHHGTQFLKPLYLDVYKPKNDPSKNKPAMVIIHGAVWGAANVDKRDPPLVRAARFFSSKGMVCFSIDFRVGPTMPDCTGDNYYMKCQYASFVDAKAAVRWIRAHADQYGIDPTRIGAFGGSSGAFSALMLAITDPEDFSTDYPGEEIPSYNTPDGDPSVQACLEFWGTCFEGWYQGEQWIFDFSYELDGGDTPIMICHGTLDTVIPFADAEQLEALCVSTGLFSRFYPLEGYGHGCWDATYEGKSLLQLSKQFLKVDLGWPLP